MRIRSIKPEFWRSDDVAALSIEDRLLFIGLWSYVDDSGIGVDKTAHICADLFAPDLEANPPEVFARVTGGLQNLAERGLILRYEADGKPYLYVTNWEKHQRIDKPSKRRFPTPDEGKHRSSGGSREDSGRATEKVAPGAGEQGNRGTGEQEDLLSSADAPDERTPPRHPYSQDFLDWWEHYPRKESKGAAFKAWKQIKDRHLPTLIAAADRYAADPNREPRFTKLPASWLNARAWEDETPLPSRAGRPDSTSRLASIQALKQRGGDDGWNGMRALTS